MVDFAMGVFDRGSWKIGRLRLITRDRIEKRTLAAVGLANKNDIGKIILFRQRSQPLFFGLSPVLEQQMYPNSNLSQG